MKKKIQKLQLNKFAVAKLSYQKGIKGGHFSDSPCYSEDLEVCWPLTEHGLACQGPPTANEEANTLPY